MKFRKKPVVVEAVQWAGFVDREVTAQFNIKRHPTTNLNLHDKCPSCIYEKFNHGQIDTLEGVHIVCPGDWIITGIKGERYPCKPDIFEKTYDMVEEITE